MTLNGLPFVTTDDAGNATGLWAPDRSGSYEEQCRRGREYAATLIDHIQRTDVYPLLGWIISAWGAQKGGVEIGFMQQLAEAATGSAAV